jgi:hypothetical protein
MFLYHNSKVKHKLYITSGPAHPTSKISVASLQSQCVCNFSKISNLARRAHKLYLLCNFDSNEWGIKNALLERQIKFWLHLGILVETHFRNTRSFATHDVKVLSTRELYLQGIEYYRLNIFFDIRIFLKIRVWHCTYVCYNRCKFGCDRNVIKEALIEKQYTFAIFSWLPLEWFSWKFIHWTPRV